MSFLHNAFGNACPRQVTNRQKPNKRKEEDTRSNCDDFLLIDLFQYARGYRLVTRTQTVNFTGRPMDFPLPFAAFPFPLLNVVLSLEFVNFNSISVRTENSENQK